MPVRLQVGEMTSEPIGTIPWPFRVEHQPTGNGFEATIRPVKFAEVRSELAGLLRSAADEMENPTPDEEVG